MSTDLKHACHECGGNIAYPQHAFGAIVHCPHCGQQTTLGEKYPETPEPPATVKTRRVADTPLTAPASLSADGGGGNRKALLICLAVLALVVVLAGGVAVGMRSESQAKREVERKATEETEKAKAKVEAEEQAKATAKALAAAKQEAIAKAVAQVQREAIDRAAEVAAKAAKEQEEKKAQALAAKIARLKTNPVIWPLWEEADHDAIRITATKENEATLLYKTKGLTVKHSDMPDWLKTAAVAKHKDDGEALGLIRVVNGTTHDLRANPPGWVVIQRAVVIQIIDDGYLMIDESALYAPGAPSGSGVFKLLHNGFNRIFTKDTRLQVRGLSVGTYTYTRKAGDTVKVPVYDPGMPQGPLAKSAIPMAESP